MHWISILSAFLIVAICQGQVISGGNGADASGPHNGADGSVQVSAGNVPSGSFMQHNPNGQNNMHYGNSPIETGRNDGQRTAGNTALQLFFFPMFAALMYL